MRNYILPAACLLFASPLLPALFADGGDASPEPSSNPHLPALRDTTEAERAVRTINKYGGWVSRDTSVPNAPIVFADLKPTVFTDEALRGIGALKDLRVLHLEISPVTDAGLAHLRGLGMLYWLDLSFTQVTDRGMKQLRQDALCGLQYLNLDSTAVTDAGAKDIAALKGLRRIDFSQTKVTDDGIKGLAALPDLRDLNLYGTPITDESLKVLSTIKSLKFLSVGRTGVTPSGVDSFKKVLPGCRVDTH